jgi:hypothetical protein
MVATSSDRHAALVGALGAAVARYQLQLTT